jgi:hypothetical protein
VKKTLLLLPLALIAALALAACGGGSSSSGDSEGAIESAIETAATSSDPSKCTEVQTAAFNETETGSSGKEALATCEEEAESDSAPAESVDVSDISVDGEKATAEVAIEGGSLNGQSVEVELLEEEGDWKLNKFLKLTDFDSQALSESFAEKLGEEEGISPELAKCISEGVVGMSEADAEAMIFEKDVAPIEELASNCQ